MMNDGIVLTSLSSSFKLFLALFLRRLVSPTQKLTNAVVNRYYGKHWDLNLTWRKRRRIYHDYTVIYLQLHTFFRIMLLRRKKMSWELSSNTCALVLNARPLMTQYNVPRVACLRTKFTFQKTPPATSCNLSGIQSHTVHLHTRNPSSEEATVTNPCPHSYGIIRCQSYSSNALFCNQSAVQIQFGDAGPSAVRGANVLPLSGRNAPVLNMWGGASSSPTRETGKERDRGGHPEVDTPAVRHVVENRTSASFVVDPDQKRNGILRVQLSLVRELDVTVWFPVEPSRSHGSSVRTSGLSDITKSSRRIGEYADVPSLSSIWQRVQSHSTHITCVNE